MYAVKGGWIGQTFALAKSNESGGRKARIRRSKEERKTMVETFIKKYQGSNSGNFPSLNLTHKEVGGSFYTVREIVREIIQENRVLGPGKMTQEGHDMDQVIGQGLLGSISTEPENTLLMSPNGSSHLVPSLHQGTVDDSVLVSDALVMEPEYQKVDNGMIVKGSQVDGTNEDDETVSAEFEENKTMEAEESGKELSSVNCEVTQLTMEAMAGPCANEEIGEAVNPKVEVSKPVEEEESYKEKEVTTPNVTQISQAVMADNHVKNGTNKAENEVSKMTESLDTNKNKTKAAFSASGVTELMADITVETFPLRPLTKLIDNTDKMSCEINTFTETSDERGTASGKENGNLCSDGKLFSQNFGLMDNNGAEKHLDLSSEIVDKKGAGNLSGSHLETNIETSASVHDTHSGARLGVDMSPNNTLISETNVQKPVIAGKVVSTSKVIHPETNGSIAGNATRGLPAQEAVAVENKIVQHTADSGTGRNTKLDRISLESWKGTSKTTAESETNPLLSIFKSFIAAFVKFWSE